MGSPKTGSSTSQRSASNKTGKRKRKPQRNPSLDDHNALCLSTDSVLRRIITTDEHFGDLPPDCTLEELQAEIALARGQATTIYVKREGLTTLKVVLPQPNPTIANLKRAIERTANLLQQRKTSSQQRQQQQQQASSDREKATVTKSSTDTPPRQSGGGVDLVAAVSTRTERRPHRTNASWRFLWRAYALCKAQDPEQPAPPSPLADANGRQLLSDYGIGHKSVLRFVKRENYFGRRRQRS